MLGDHDRVSTAQTIMMYLVEEYIERNRVDDMQRAAPFDFFPFDPEDVLDIIILDDRDGFLDVDFVLLNGHRYSREGVLRSKKSAFAMKEK